MVNANHASSNWSLGSNRNEMHLWDATWQFFVFAQFDRFLVASIFSSKIQCPMSKRKQVQSSLNSLFGGKQEQEINTTPTMPAEAPNKRTRKFQESWKETIVILVLLCTTKTLQVK